MTDQIAQQIQSEQDHGRQKYHGSAINVRGDDNNSITDWQDFMETHLHKLSHDSPQEQRQRLVKIAGLAVSAIESFDRKNP